MKREARINSLSAAAVAGLACLLLYLPTLRCGFVNMDDPAYVLNNPLLELPLADMLVAAFTQAHAGWWMPLTWLSFALDHAIWGFNPLGYHLTNTLLHAVNTGLVVIVGAMAYRAVAPADAAGESGGDVRIAWWLPLLAGLLFGAHPLRVESVAWVTERKDVLNGLLTLGSVICYWRYAGGGKRSDYLLSLLLFAGSLMAKSVSVVLPVVFLVIDWYPLHRIRKGAVGAVIREKLPFFALSAAIAVVTLMTTAESSYLVSLDQFPLWQRLVVSGNAVVEYLRLMLFPVGVVYLYMIPEDIPPDYLVKAVITLVGIAALLSAGRRRPAYAALLLLFLLPLLPVLALFQNGDQSYAARFTYLPSISISIAAAWCIAKWCGGRRAVRRAIAVCVAALLLWYAWMTQQLVSTWKDSGTLWSRVIALQPGAMAYKERGVFLYSQGRYLEAAEDFTSSIRSVQRVWRPYVHNLYAHRGEALRAAGRYEEAAADFTLAIKRSPQPAYYHFRGMALQLLGREREAAEDLARGGGAVTGLDWYWVEGTP